MISSTIIGVYTLISIITLHYIIYYKRMLYKMGLPLPISPRDGSHLDGRGPSLKSLSLKMFYYANMRLWALKG